MRSLNRNISFIALICASVTLVINAYLGAEWIQSAIIVTATACWFISECELLALQNKIKGGE